MEALGDASRRLLWALASPKREPIDWRTAIIVAHPDDETIGCGAQLGRFRNLEIVHVTDGAPRQASPPEFGGWERYRDVRARELRRAMAVAGVREECLLTLGWPDQEARLHLMEIAAELARRLAGVELVLTHAYEGGHPDHDSTAFAVWAAGELIKREGGATPLIVEMPLYRAGAADWAVQSFAESGPDDVELRLASPQQELKAEMFAAYPSQQAILSRFGTEVERFRPASPDFSGLPNGGRILYEGFGWGMSGSEWLVLAQESTQQLGLSR